MRLTRRAFVGLLTFLSVAPRLSWAGGKAAAPSTGVARGGVGDFTVSWERPFPDASYPVVAEAGRHRVWVHTVAPDYVRLVIFADGGVPVDAPFVVVAPWNIVRGGA